MEIQLITDMMMNAFMVPWLSMFAIFFGAWVTKRAIFD